MTIGYGVRETLAMLAPVAFFVLALVVPRLTTAAHQQGAVETATAQPSSLSSKSGQAAMSTPWFSGEASVHQWGACV